MTCSSAVNCCLLIASFSGPKRWKSHGVEISCRYALEKSFITCVTLEKLQTCLLLAYVSCLGTHLAQIFAKRSSPTIFAAFPWLSPRRSATSSIVTLRLSRISWLTLALFPGLTVDDGLPLLCLSWRLLKFGSSSPLILDIHFLAAL